VLAFGLILSFAQSAHSQSSPGDTTLRDAGFEWEEASGLLYVSLAYRDVVDEEVQNKLSRGLPTTAIYRAGSNAPLSTTAQTCKVTWHVWEEAYRVEITRPGSTQVRWTTTVEGVLRRCAEARRLLAGNRNQIPHAALLFALGKIQVNPLSAELLQKLKRWVMRPSGTSTASSGDALFSTFTGLFLQRVGDAERELKFTTRPLLPVVLEPESR
jgi:hypothetical protein